MTDVKTDRATELALLAVEKVVALRKRMEEAVRALEAGRSNDALDLLRLTLVETDVGKMKVWQPGEEPF